MKDLTGKAFGKFTVIKRSNKVQGKHIMWDCLCACGKARTVRQYNLVNRLSESCGCLKADKNALKHDETVLARFHTSYIPVTESGCWIWELSVDRRGYGYFQLKQRTIKAHRLSWILHNGSIPEGLCVLHKCDTPSCVNPQHLFLGTQQDNTADKVAKKRQAYGAKNGRALLTDRDVTEIRSVYPFVSRKDLCFLYGISRGALQHVILNRNWTHI